ncbi:MAG TPA: extracellular solute-binding protein [Acidimicrobiales bacterium]|nr:extracellular solute-binding protein [Acidimicrobiales bacterium]
MRPNFGGRARAALIATATGLSVLALVTAATGAGASSVRPSSGHDATGVDGSTFSVLLTTEDSQTPQVLQLLAKGACASEAKALPLSIQQVPSQNIESKIQLEASQNALPLLYAADNTDIEPGGDLYTKGDVLDISSALQGLGVASDMTSIAKSTTEQQFVGTVPSVPFQMNIEGLFYNKKIFAKYGISVPTTYTALLADAAKLKAAGVTPFTASGSSGWAISRWVGVLLFRELGPKALQLVADNKASLSSPAYVKAAQQVAQLGADGYFSTGVTNLSYNQAIDEFLTGKAAMIYMGTWLLSSISSSQDTVGQNNIGFMPFPGVPGGKGSINQYPANTGSPNVINARLYGPKAQAWLKCIAENDGSLSLKKQDVFTGFRTNTPVSGLNALTKQVEHTINTAGPSVLWFEALFGPKANADASADAAALLTGAMSPKQYMGTLQSDNQTQP